ncbi:MAG TPA: sodium/proton-translocating pyrophosphatase, partial [Bacillota bacterium]|nr:sodium/proton-translocating pyrophosphatase [Bacillota bacterium]
MTSLVLWGALGASVLGLLFAAYFAMSVLKEDQGNARMKELSQAIFEGAMAFLNRQYRTLIPFTAIIFIALFFTKHTYMAAASFLVGAVFSGVAGYV